jgi:hypothetical protein
MKMNHLLSVVVFIALFLFMPFTAGAAPVTWSSESYRAYAYANTTDFYYSILSEDEMEKWSPPNSIPMDASAYAEISSGAPPGYSYPDLVYGIAGSSVLNSSFDVSVDAFSW